MIELVITVIVIAAPAVILLNVIINAVFGPFLKKGPKSAVNRKVSILVPARNEEKNIGRCLDSLLKQNYPNFEIIALDDSSTDKTLEVLEIYANSYDNIKAVKGEPLPEGWIGKNWACRQLAWHATGEIMIYTDADVWHDSSAVSKTIGLMEKHDLDFISAFSQQKTVTFFEKLIIPVIDLIIYSFLILWSTKLLKSKMLAAANGQWLAIKKSVYDDIDGHESVKDKIVEDVELSKLIKARGYRILTTAGTGIVFCRMYSSLTEIWEGLTKNLFGISANSFFVLFIFLSIITISAIIPFFLLFTKVFLIAALISIALNILWRSLLAVRFGHPFLIGVLLHPISALFLIAIGLNSAIKSKFGKVSWKGREFRLNAK